MIDLGVVAMAVGVAAVASASIVLFTFWLGREDE